MKYLIWLIVAVVAGLWWSSLRRRRAEDAARPPVTPPAPTPGGQQTMRLCAHCGVHLPEADAVTRAGLPYCSGAHADAGPRPPGA